MSKISLFVASCSNFNYENNSNLSKGKRKDAELLKAIITEVETKFKMNSGFDELEIIPWWNEPNFFRAGSIRETIKTIAHNYDIGVFVLENDKNDVRPKGAKQGCHTPNSNVYLEYGLFMSLDKPCYIIRRDDDTTLPSDINNEQAPVLENTEKIVKGVLDTIGTFQKNRNNTLSLKEKNPYKNTQIYFDSGLSTLYMKIHSSEADEKQVFIGYETKALFIGSKSAYLWKKIESNNEQYFESLVIQKFVSIENGWDKIRGSKIKQFNNINVNNIVSLGPGIGSIDEALIEPLRGNNRRFFYIPIDINPLLAIASMEKIRNHVAFAVVDDFEDNNFFYRLKELLKSKEPEIGNNNLFSMLGVTFSNLSSNGNSLFNNINSIMVDVNDYFLLDVIIYDKDKEGKTFLTDKEIITKITEQINGVYKDFMLNTMERKGFGCDIQELHYQKSNPNNRYTIIPDTKVVEVQYPKNKKKRKTLLIAKYYKYDNIKCCLKKHFEVVASAKYIEFGDMGRGVFLLQKKTKGNNGARKTRKMSKQSIINLINKTTGKSTGRELSSRK